MALGAYIAGAPSDPSRLDAFATQVGRMPAIVMWYQQWGLSDARTLDLRLLQAVRHRGATPLITWEPWDPREDTDQPAYRLAAIARGDFDAYARSWATGLAAYRAPVYLRFAHEMNGDWYPWCIGVNGNRASDYVAAWHRLYGLFTAAGASNVRWVWSPNVDYTGASPLGTTYPGDARVDWLALDGYNWGQSRAGTRWRSFAHVFAPSYRRLRSVAVKPIMIAETASAESSGTTGKGRWIMNAFRRTLPRQFPDVRAIVWFNEAKEAGWPVDSSSATLRAYRQVVATPAYQGTLPP